MVMRSTGEVICCEFRNDFMEGKRRNEKTLSRKEVEKYFNIAFKNTEHFIDVGTFK